MHHSAGATGKGCLQCGSLIHPIGVAAGLLPISKYQRMVLDHRLAARPRRVAANPPPLQEEQSPPAGRHSMPPRPPAKEAAPDPDPGTRHNSHGVRRIRGSSCIGLIERTPTVRRRVRISVSSVRITIARRRPRRPSGLYDSAASNMPRVISVRVEFSCFSSASNSRSTSSLCPETEAGSGARSNTMIATRS